MCLMMNFFQQEWWEFFLLIRADIMICWFLFARGGQWRYGPFYFKRFAFSLQIPNMFRESCATFLFTVLEWWDVVVVSGFKCCCRWFLIHHIGCLGASHLDGIPAELGEVISEHWRQFPPQVSRESQNTRNTGLFNFFICICFYIYEELVILDKYRIKVWNIFSWFKRFFYSLYNLTLKSLQVILFFAPEVNPLS